ncbi:MAG: DNA polymerase III subunit gamma/tau [Ectothiorhodospiraceae bacterium]|nr:DNA polymerase III subunit gamma/tau [Ectothiorhodospiraceae bacterium]
MSYQVLARKWRPRTFTELVGQEHVLKALVNALDNDRLHHAFLFTGTRGVGKTTIARILAKSLNCEKGVSSTPCGKCSACTEINEGRFVDLIEVDAASRTKVEETRELLDNVQYAPTRGRYKVYLIDEVHMFSNHSFNALLKTLEEPPPHVKFLLATTDPQKLPVTILSRCLQFNLKRLPVEQIRGHLEKVLGEENIDNENAALALISRAADGSMRDALSLLDQAIAYGSGRVAEQDVRAMLGSIEQSHVIDLLNLLAANDAPGLLTRISELAQHSPDFAGVLAELISTLHRIALAQTAPGAIDDGLGDREDIVALSTKISPEDIQLYYQIGLIGRRDLPLAPDARGGFEMVMLRMLAFRPAASSQPVNPPAKPSVKPSANPSSNQNTAPRVAPQSTGPSSTPAPPQTTRQAMPHSQVQHPPPASNASPAASPAPVTMTQTAPQVAEPMPATFPVAATPAPATTTAPFSSTDDWENLVNAMKLSGMLQQLATNCALARVEGNHYQISMSPNHKYLLNKSREDGLAKALGQHLGREITLTITLESVSSATPAERQQQRSGERQTQAENMINSDATVQAIVEAFDGQIKPGSVQPF